MPSLERFVYLVKAGENHYKVGIAQDVMDRIKSIQTGNPIRVELVTAVWLADAQVAERRIHKWLSRFKSDGGREWFELTSDQVVFLVMKMTSLTMPDDVSRYLVVRNLLARQDAIEKRLAMLERPAGSPALKIVDSVQLPNPKEVKAIEEKEMFDEAVQAVVIAGRASASMLQRRLRVGYARAARLLDELEEAKAIGPADGARPREVLITSPLDVAGVPLSSRGRD